MIQTDQQANYGIMIINHHKTRPAHPKYHFINSMDRRFVFEVDTGKLINVKTVSSKNLQALSDAMENHNLGNTVSKVADNTRYTRNGAAPKTVPLQSLSLAIAQKCNLGCTYCYAEQGTFGGKPDNMSWEIAKASVDRLFLTAPIDEPISLAFMGGEPLFNRSVLHQATAYAAENAKKFGRKVKFLIVTNATLIRPEDVALFQEHAFSVTVSIDGVGATNDKLRPYISGKGTFKDITKKLRLLFDVPNRRFKVSARVTVTLKNMNLPETFRGLADMGFDSIQFSPMAKSPTGKEELPQEGFDMFLEQIIECGEMFRHAFNNKQLLPLQNVLSTLRRIHKYEHETYPCGAGGGYMGVSAEGELYACHRFVNDDDGFLGSVQEGVSAEKQEQWLQNRHLNEQKPCTTCWARYLCSGSCHHEVIKRGRPACDYIRGWLYYCLGLYADLAKSDPIGLKLLLGDKLKFAGAETNEDGTGIQY